MELDARIALVVGLFSLAFMLNVPMGLLRARSVKFSAKWWLCVHATIPVVYFGRMFSGLDWRYIPIFICAVVLGQYAGGRTGLE